MTPTLIVRLIAIDLQLEIQESMWYTNSYYIHSLTGDIHKYKH